MSLKHIFQGFWRQVQNTYFVEQLSMVAYDNILGEKHYVIFRLILIPLEKLSTHLFIPFLRVTKEGGFYSKYLLWGCVNKWG